uniref:Uncharacterized protein n=1 Tax=Romanomermis culicivorax TaxID=13658 RepID=A0A915IDV8_ROMCU
MQQLLMLLPVYLCNTPFDDVFAVPREYHLLSVIVYIANHFTCILLRPGTSSKEYFLCDNLQERIVWIAEGIGNGHLLQYALYYLDC